MTDVCDSNSYVYGINRNNIVGSNFGKCMCVFRFKNKNLLIQIIN